MRANPLIAILLGLHIAGLGQAAPSPSPHDYGAARLEALEFVELAAEMEGRIQDALAAHFSESLVDVEILGGGAVKLLCKVRTREKAYPGVQENLRLLATTINREVLGKYYRAFHLSPSSALVVLNRREGALPEDLSDEDPFLLEEPPSSPQAREVQEAQALETPPEPKVATAPPRDESKGRAMGRELLRLAMERRLAGSQPAKEPPPSPLPGAAGVVLEDKEPPPATRIESAPSARPPYRVPALLAELDRITRTPTPKRLTLGAPTQPLPVPRRIIAAPERAAAKQGFLLEAPLPLPQSELARLARSGPPSMKLTTRSRRELSRLVAIGKSPHGPTPQVPTKARPPAPASAAPPLLVGENASSRVPAPPAKNRVQKLWGQVFDYWRWPWDGSDRGTSELPPLETVPIPTHLPKPPAAPVLARAEDEFVEDDLSEIGAFGKDYTPSEFFEEELGDLSQDWENSF